MENVFAIFCIIAVILFYFIPTLVAYNNKNTQTAAILALNFFLGWTLIGWLAALVWASCKPAKKQSNVSVADEIKKLADLKEQGVLSEDEFNEKKKQLLENE